MLLHNMGTPGAPADRDDGHGRAGRRHHRIDSQGALRFTGNHLDIALVGTGHFTIDTPNGRRYTRDGSFWPRRRTAAW